MGTSIKPLMKANQAADDSVGGDHSRRPPQSDRVPSPRLILSHRALSLGGYRTYWGSRRAVLITTAPSPLDTMGRGTVSTPDAMNELKNCA